VTTLRDMIKATAQPLGPTDPPSKQQAAKLLKWAEQNKVSPKAVVMAAWVVVNQDPDLSAETKGMAMQLLRKVHNLLPKED